jgi:hypothetical protein
MYKYPLLVYFFFAIDFDGNVDIFQTCKRER